MARDISSERPPTIIERVQGTVRTSVVIVVYYRPDYLDNAISALLRQAGGAVEIICSNEKVKAVLFNIFGGITRCDDVANGLIEAFKTSPPSVPIVVRLDGTNDEAGRKLLADADLPGVHAAATMNEAAEMVVALAKGEGA